MQILVISPLLPYPLDSGGRIRMFHLVKNYGQHGEVTLVAIGARSEDWANVKALRPLCREIFLFPKETCAFYRRSASVPVRRIRKLFAARPPSIQSYFSPAMVEGLKRLTTRSWDLIHVSGLSMVPTFRSARQVLRKGRTLLNLDDLDSVKLWRQTRLEPLSRHKLYQYVELARVMSYERVVIPSFDWCLVCSETDARLVRRRGLHSRPIVVPNGVPIEDFRPERESDDGRTLLFLGNMAYYPNADAARYFLKDIFHHIKTASSATRFVIAGQDPPADLLAKHDGRDVIVTGRFDEVQAVLAQATVVVTPLRFGSGTRIKILEAMAFSKPVVTTSIGCEGLEVRREEHLIIEDHPRCFAARCVGLLTDAETRRRLSRAGRSLVESRYDWHRVMAPLNALLKRNGHPRERAA